MHCLAKVSFPTPSRPEMISARSFIPLPDWNLSSNLAISSLRPTIVVSSNLILGFALQIIFLNFCSISRASTYGLLKRRKLKHSSFFIHSGQSSIAIESSIIKGQKRSYSVFDNFSLANLISSSTHVDPKESREIRSTKMVDSSIAL